MGLQENGFVLSFLLFGCGVLVGFLLPAAVGVDSDVFENGGHGMCSSPTGGGFGLCAGLVGKVRGGLQQAREAWAARPHSGEPECVYRTNEVLAFGSFLSFSRKSDSVICIGQSRLIDTVLRPLADGV